jgi:hypothetical protein
MSINQLYLNLFKQIRQLRPHERKTRTPLPFRWVAADELYT